MPATSRRLAGLLAIGALLMSTAAVSSAAAAEPADPLISVLEVTSVVPGAYPAVVDGPFEMVVEVTGGGASDIELTPELPSWAWWAPSAPTMTVPGGTCTATCQVTWTIDPAGQATPWYPGTAHLGVSASMGGVPLTTYGTGVNYQAVVGPTSVAMVTADATDNTAGYAPWVADTGADVLYQGPHGRAPGEQVTLLVLPAPDGTPDSERLDRTPLATATGTWQHDGDTGNADGHAHLDTSTLPEGHYRLVAQAHDGAGHYSFATPDGLVVQHSPMVSLTRPGTAKVTAGAGIDFGLTVRNPRSSTAALGTVVLTVAGKVTLLDSPGAWYQSSSLDTPSQQTVIIPTAGLPLGPVAVTAQVLDADGHSQGTATTSFDVVDFADTVTIPTLVVGKPAAIHLKAAAPVGTSLAECELTLSTPLENVASINLCPGPGATAVDGSATFYPDDAGTGTVRERLRADDNVIAPDRTLPVTVYANRTATVTAPSKAAYNSTQYATVTVKDEKKRGVVSAAGSGVTVTLQRKKAGTTTWTTIGTGTTGSTGVASVKYTNTASGRLRALVTGAVPATTVTTAERSVTSVATVAWSYLPTTARSGATVTGSVYAKPYEKGATVRFQARRYGATTWSTFGSGTIGTSGYAKASARLYSRGTWEVRIQRVGTATQATGYSTTRRITIG